MLMEFDINSIEAAEYPTVTPIIVTNTADYKEVLVAQSLEIEDAIITIKK